MTEKQTPTPTPADTAAVSAMFADYFLAFLEDGNTRSGAITEQPEAQPLLAALQDIAPDATENGLLAKMFLVFCGGIDAGIEICRKIDAVAGEGAQA